MGVRVQVVSKEMIKPASLTPCELTKLKLSFLDQLTPGCYTPIIYYYASTQLQNSIVDRSQISSQLKSSLSIILTHFYPLAGIIVDGCSVDCDDEGVEYSEAQVSCTLPEMVVNRNKISSSDYFPFNLALSTNQAVIPENSISPSGEIFSAVGGIAIVVSIFHKLCDRNSETIFIKEWAATSRGVKDMVEQSFNLAGLFPPTDLLGVGLPEFGVNVEQELCVFDS